MSVTGWTGRAGFLVKPQLRPEEQVLVPGPQRAWRRDPLVAEEDHGDVGVRITARRGRDGEDCGGLRPRAEAEGGVDPRMPKFNTGGVRGF